MICFLFIYRRIYNSHQSPSHYFISYVVHLSTSIRSYIEHQVFGVAAAATFFDLTVTNGLPPLSPREECTVFTVNGRYTYWPARLFQQILIMIYTRAIDFCRVRQKLLRRNGDCCCSKARKVQLEEYVSRDGRWKNAQTATVVNLLRIS